MKKVENNVTVFQITFSILYVLLFPFLLLLLSGDWLWPEGLVGGVWFTVLCLVLLVYMYRKDPALMTERFKSPKVGIHKKTAESKIENGLASLSIGETLENESVQTSEEESNWDLFVLAGIMVTYMTWMVVMPLDAKRYGWSCPFPLWVKILGGVGLMISAFFLYRSYIDNTFASPLIRIQKERKQRVVSTGIYGFVRHPMYLGGIMMFLSMPLLLGSLYGIELGMVMVVLLIVRIVGEEKMLVKELKGYVHYQKTTRFRLIPYIW